MKIEQFVTVVASTGPNCLVCSDMANRMCSFRRLGEIVEAAGANRRV